MAYEVQEDEEEGSEEQGSVPPGTNQVSSGSGLVSTGGQTTMGAAPQSQAQFATFQKYLGANQPQANQLAERVASPIMNDATFAKTTAESAASDFNNQVANSSFKQADYDRINQGLERGAYEYRGASLPYQAPTLNRDAFDFRNDQNKDLVRQGLSAQYQGPQSLYGNNQFNEASNRYETARQKADLSNSEAGRFQLLNDMFKGPNYSRGAQSLDQLLLQNAPGAQQAFESARQATQTAGDTLNTLVSDSDQRVQAEKDRIQAQRDLLRGNISSAYEGLTGDYAQMASDLEGSRIRPEDRAMMDAVRGFAGDSMGARQLTGMAEGGLDPFKYYGVSSLAPYLNEGRAYTMDNVADPYRADLSALAELGNFENKISSIDVPDPARASFNQAQLKNDIMAKARALNERTTLKNNPMTYDEAWLQRQLGDHGYQYMENRADRRIDDVQFQRGIEAIRKELESKLKAEDAVRRDLGLGSVQALTGQDLNAWNPDFTVGDSNVKGKHAYNMLVSQLDRYNQALQNLYGTKEYADPSFVDARLFGSANRLPDRDITVTQTPIGDSYSVPVYEPPMFQTNQGTTTAPVTAPVMQPWNPNQEFYFSL